MQILNLPTNQLKSDPNQPRKYFDPVAIEELGKNISIEGIINPIEVDENYTIITGETRWRAAKLIKLPTVRAVMLTGLSPELKFRRQLLENLQNDTMNTEDMANALKKYIELFAPPQDKNRPNDLKYSWLKQELGKNKDWIESKFQWFKSSEQIKQAIRSKKIGGDFLKLYFSSIPNHRLRQAFERKVINRNIHTRKAGQAVASALRNYPEHGEAILKIDYENLRDSESVKQAIAKIIPGYSETPVTDILEKKLEPAENLANTLVKLNKLLKEYTWDDIPNHQIHRIVLNFIELSTKLKHWEVKNKQYEKLS